MGSGKRVVSMTIAATRQDEFLEQFDPEELTDDRMDYDLGSVTRCTQKVIYFRHRVVWFSVTLQVFENGRWLDVARVDTCHDQAHIHQFGKGRRAEVGRRTLREVRTIDDVEQSYDQALDEIDAWATDEERRWHHGS